MNKEIETLGRLFKDFMNLKNDRDFYLGFIQYFNYVNTNPFLKQIVETYVLERIADDEKINNTVNSNLDNISSSELEYLFYDLNDREVTIVADIYNIQKLFQALTQKVINNSNKNEQKRDYFYSVHMEWRKVKNGNLADSKILNTNGVKRTLIRVHNQLIIDIQNEKTKNNILSELDLYGGKMAITLNAMVFINTNGSVNEYPIKNTTVKIIKFLHSRNKFKKNQYFLKKDIATNPSVNKSIKTVEASFTEIRKISNIIGIEILKEDGIDSKGRKYKLNEELID